MMQVELINSTKASALEGLSKEVLIQKYTVLEFELARTVREVYKLKNQKITDEQLQFVMAEQLNSLKNEIFGTSSERYKRPVKDSDDNAGSKPPKKPRIKQLSKRYPNIAINEQIIAMDPVPACPCCGDVMSDSGMTEDSEQLTVIPKKYEILLQKKVKYRCKCHGSIITAPSPARIIEGSSYSDEMIKDIVVSKYCDLIPIERYSAMASRAGLLELPPHSLIEVTHQFADFVSGVYKLIKAGVLEARVLHADETPHRMLEGSKKKSWYLWGFSTPKVCFLECHDTRSGDVASNILLNSKCEVLVTDVYSGYGKAIKISNKERITNNKSLIKSGYCNAHARRYFFKAFPDYKESTFYLDHYHEIYQLNSKAKGKPPPDILELRAQMKIRFEDMKQQAIKELSCYPVHGKYAKALKYFTLNYDGLTLFLNDAEVPIDNNSQERLLRNHVVGRKTWYGTHSERGALTAAVLFSIIETCKLCQVNPKEYLENLVQDLLSGKKPYTPQTFKDSRPA